MRKWDSGKKNRFERPSLMPLSERRAAESSAPTPSSAPPARRSWAPEAIVKAKALPEAGWTEYDTNSHPAIPVAPPTGSMEAPATRESMIPRAPAVPRMSLGVPPPPAARSSMAPRVPPPPRPSLGPALPSQRPNMNAQMPPPRTSMTPDTASRSSLTPRTGTARNSVPPTRGGVPDPWERFSLTPAYATQSLAPARGKPEDPAADEDRRYTQALFLREQGRTQEALLMLDDVCASAPEHADARVLQLKLAIELGSEERIGASAEWVLQHYAQQAQHTQVCWVYRTVRMSFPQHVWSERALLQALIAGDKNNEGRVVVDVTKLLLQAYPESPALPRALYASAVVQYNEGRPDLSKATLQNLIARFPLDPLAQVARRKLPELG